MVQYANVGNMALPIEATRLVKKYDTLTAVDGIDFTVREGECVGFLGPNGAGKTTTVRMVTCFTPITCGPGPGLWSRCVSSAPRSEEASRNLPAGG